MVGIEFDNCFVSGSSHVVEQLSFSLFLSILTLDFDLILESFFTFRGPNRLFLGLREGSITVLGSTQVVEQLLFCMFSSIRIFEFYIILGSFLTFWDPNGLFFGVRVWFDNCFGVYSFSWTTLIFFVSFNSDIWFWLNFYVIFLHFWAQMGYFCG